MIVLGEIGHGKSALLKTLLWRMLLFGRRAFVLDVKGEYAPLCAAADAKPVALAPGNGVCLNPLSARPSRAAQVEMLRAVARTALGRPLRSRRTASLREALVDVRDRERDGEATIPRVLELLFEPTAEMCDAASHHAGELAAAPRRGRARAARPVRGTAEGNVRRADHARARPRRAPGGARPLRRSRTRPRSGS